MRHRTSIKAAVLALVFGFVLWPGAAMAFTLVTPEEYAREAARPAPPKLRDALGPDFGNPKIELVRPRLTGSLASPIDMEIRFVPVGAARIVIGSLRIRYGFFGLDITDRVLKHARVTGHGIVASGASLPTGTHRITIEVTDDLKRRGRRTFRIVIAR